MKLKHLVLVLPAAAVAGIVFAQGPLAPPGAPAPAMKTLDQIEPRTPVSTVPFVITQPGSYYLTGNIQFTAASGNAITINTSDVTLDLMGFTLSSGNAVTGDAVRINGGLRNVGVRNGVIAGNTTVTVSGNPPNHTWNVAPAGFSTGINAFTIQNGTGNCHFSHLRIFGCRAAGLNGGLHAVVERVTAAQNGGSGIGVSADGSLTNCNANSNGGNGIIIGSGIIANCTASLNGGTGIDGDDLAIAHSSAVENGDDGINTGSGSVTNCFARGNDGNGISGYSVANSVAVGNTGQGIMCNGGSVANCSASSNGGTGIVASPGTITNSVGSDNEGTGMSALFGAVSHSFAYLNGSHGINCQSGTVDFCKSYQNNMNGGSGVDINAPGGTIRTGNNPAP